MKDKILQSVCFALILFLISASTAIGQRILSRPLKYNEPNKSTDFRPVTDSERDFTEPWFVLSIHDNAPLYSDPGSTNRTGNINYGELFYVVEEQGDYLRIAEDDRPDVFNLSGSAKITGWLRKDDVLLWRNSLLEPKSKIPLKGMLLNTTRVLGSDQINYRRVESYKDPSMQIPTGYESRLFEIFFIYKYSPRNNSVLLGRSQYFSAMDYNRGTITSNIIGWVDLNRVLEWDTRVAIEPNWSVDAVNERQQKNILAKVFNPSDGGSRDRCARDFSRGQIPRNCDVAWQENMDDEKMEGFRQPGYWRRFPVTGDPGQEVYEIMVMGELTSQSGQKISHDVDVKTRQGLNELIEKYRNINIVFVIDGTNSMQPFYQPAINSVDRIVETIKRTGEGLKNLRFGYVVYRDYAERDRLVEVRQLTSQADAIVRELQKIEARDLYDSDTHEAVYYGLKTAFERIFAGNTNDTNILIHIGDAGNHYRSDPSRVSQSDIIDLLVKYKCHYIAYQAHRAGDDQAYRDFPHQIREIMSRSAEQIYNEWMALGRDDLERPVLKEVSRNVHRIENGHPMVVMSAAPGQTMNLRVLEDEISRAIEEIDNYTDITVELARELLERGRGIDEIVTREAEGKYVSSFASGVYNFLVRLGLDENEISNYYSKNLQFVTEGYTAMYHPELNTPLFAPVLLMENREFMRIHGVLDRLRTATASPGDRRENLRNAWFEILKRHVGGAGVQDSNFEEMTLQQASSMVIGVPIRSGMLDMVLRDITDPSVFTDDMLSKYVNYIVFKYNELDVIANKTNYPYSFMSNDILYYWIDLELLP